MGHRNVVAVGLWGSYVVFSCVDCCVHCRVTAELWRTDHSSRWLFPESGTVCTISQTNSSVLWLPKTTKQTHTEN